MRRFTIWHLITILVFAAVMRGIIALMDIAISNYGLTAALAVFFVALVLGLVIEQRAPKSQRLE